jgi:glycosyltransferase involved in cell wall biosynthesis
MPVEVGRLLGNIGLSGSFWTALRMTELVGLRHASFHGLIREVDHVVALCQWVKDLLLRNGVPAEKVTVSRQGLCQEQSRARSANSVSGSLRVAALGRLDATKGAHVLIEALRRIPEVPVRLDIYGVAQGDAGRAYCQRLSELVSGDSRIAFCPSIPNDEVVTRLQDYDVLAVPSQWLETGPIVVLEAFAAGIPVVGSNLGGIAELVKHGANGLLVEARSVFAWSCVMERLATDRNLLSRLRSGVRPPRTMLEAAAEMSTLYARLTPGWTNRMYSDYQPSKKSALPPQPVLD